MGTSKKGQCKDCTFYKLTEHGYYICSNIWSDNTGDWMRGDECCAMFTPAGHVYESGNVCAACGVEIPEGRQICPRCEKS